MKKIISISADEKVIEDFTALAEEFWTNRTNLISMFMVDSIRTKKFVFERPKEENNIEFEAFTEQQNKSLMEKWWKTISDIFNSLDKQLWQ